MKLIFFYSGMFMEANKNVQRMWPALAWFANTNHLFNKRKANSIEILMSMLMNPDGHSTLHLIIMLNK